MKPFKNDLDKKQTVSDDNASVKLEKQPKPKINKYTCQSKIKQEVNEELKSESDSGSDVNSESNSDLDSDSDLDQEQSSLDKLDIKKKNLVRIDIMTKNGCSHWIDKKTFKVYSQDMRDKKWVNSSENFIEQFSDKIEETIQKITKSIKSVKSVKSAKSFKSTEKLPTYKSKAKTNIKYINKFDDEQEER